MLFRSWNHALRAITSGAAETWGIADHYGTLQPGKDADLVIWDPDATVTVAASALEHRNKITPYAGEVLRGAVRATYLRGAAVYDHGRFTGPRGRLLGARA